MKYVFYASLLFVAVLFLGAFGFGVFWLGTLLLSRPQYHNKLGLVYLSRFAPFQRATRKKSLFGAEEELLHIAERLEEMRLARQSLADLLKNEAEREACRQDVITVLLQKTKERLHVEKSTPSTEASNEMVFELAVDFISQRKWRAQRIVLLESLMERASVELSQVEGWRPRVTEDATRMAFHLFKGGYVIKREAQCATAVMLWLDEPDEFDAYRRERGSYIHLLSFTGGQPIRVDLLPPAESGRLEIIRKKDNALEPIALP